MYTYVYVPAIFFSNQRRSYRSEIVGRRCSKTRKDFASRQKVSTRVGILAGRAIFLIIPVRGVCFLLPPPLPTPPPFLFIFLCFFLFPSSMRAVSESQPSWVQHYARACASRPSLLRAPCVVRIIPPAGVSWIVACSAIAGTGLNPMHVNVCVCNEV